MSEETLFEKLGVKYIEKDGIFYPLITLGGEENSTDVGKYGRMWIHFHKRIRLLGFVFTQPLIFNILQQFISYFIYLGRLIM